MATTNPSDFLRRLTRGMAVEALSDQSDRQLVERALAGRDEAAFQAIVQHHGPMVYRVCWRVSQHSQDAEDAFQATFLVLAQKLRSMRKHASLASWLHGVARRVALKAKVQAMGRRRHEHDVSRRGSAVPPDDVTWKELRSVLDAELGKLPEKWRLPLIVCYLEGRTQDEAAGQLAWSKSTLRRRLEEARDALGHRLNRRGVVWPAALSAVLVSESMAVAAPELVAATVEVAAGAAAGKTAMAAASVEVAALTQGVLKAMFITKLKAAVSVLLMLGIAGLTCGVLAFGMTGAKGDGVEKPAAKANERPNDNPGEKGDVLTVSIKSQKYQIRADESFKVDLRVVNASDSPHSFRVMNCSWDEHWKSSNDRIFWESWDCAENAAETVKLAPGESYEKTLPMLLRAGKPQEKVLFKMAFTPIGSKQTYWSNEIAIQVEPEAKSKLDLQFHPSATPTDLKIELTSAAKATRPHKAIYLPVKVTNMSPDEILAGAGHEWGDGPAPAKLPGTGLYASIAPAKDKKAAVFLPAYLAGDGVPEIPESITLEAVMDPIVPELVNRKSTDLLLRLDWPTDGSVPGRQFPDAGGTYTVQLLLVVQKKAREPQKLQYVVSEPTTVEVPALKPVGGKPEPWTGEPSNNNELGEGKKLSTFKRLPKAADAMLLRLNSFGGKGLPPRLTAANFPKLLDSMKPVKADDPKYTRISISDWAYTQFETPEGRFQLIFYLGGLADLTAPDGSVGRVTFDMPK